MVHEATKQFQCHRADISGVLSALCARAYCDLRESAVWRVSGAIVSYQCAAGRRVAALPPSRTPASTIKSGAEFRHVPVSSAESSARKATTGNAQRQ
jgi:hypothetical protein